MIMENSPNLMNEIDTQVQEARSPKEDEPKKTHTETHRHEYAKG